jgi:tetratricopeptide (TPR) repeat protein
MVNQQKLEEDRKLEQADEYLDKANKFIEKNQFKEAKDEYRKAIDIFKELGWWKQVDDLYEEIKNVEEYKKQAIMEQRKRKEEIKKREEKFQKRLEELQKQETSDQEPVKGEQTFLPIEIKQKLNKIDILKKKAQKEKDKGLINRVIERYENIIEIYNSIPKDKVDVGDDIKKLKTRISILKTKK